MHWQWPLVEVFIENLVDASIISSFYANKVDTCKILKLVFWYDDSIRRSQQHISTFRFTPEKKLTIVTFEKRKLFKVFTLDLSKPFIPIFQRGRRQDKREIASNHCNSSFTSRYPSPTSILFYTIHNIILTFLNI